MTFQTAVFYLFAAILVFAALRVITTRNPVNAALWLVLSFFTAAGRNPSRLITPLSRQVTARPSPTGFGPPPGSASR